MTSSSNSSAKHSTETTWEMLNLKPVLNPRRSSSAPSQPTLPSMTTSPTHSRKLLDEWPATALCGNDLLSSVFYTLGLCVRLAGIYAPLCFLWVSLVFLLPIRWIYGELGQWMPWNGGSWNVVLTLWARDGTHPRRAHSLLALSGTWSLYLLKHHGLYDLYIRNLERTELRGDGCCFIVLCCRIRRGRIGIRSRNNWHYTTFIHSHSFNWLHGPHDLGYP